ncbi:hypothetical protein [Latilactobacillus curvatus]|nr:hypothetical protein [Latilactobacillus curvatus]MDT7016351.1 hypothetical protein [Latilactobacillus curvatus]
MTVLQYIMLIMLIISFIGMIAEKKLPLSASYKQWDGREWTPYHG